ncbi:MAG TPA: type II secretion system protein N [Myxococcota bacterium]|nr:type II secretion system protein N [Myxococcota bacterium]
MASSRSSRRLLLAFAGCLLLAAAIASVVARRPARFADTDATSELARPAIEEAPQPVEAVAPPSAPAQPARAEIPRTTLPLRLLATVVGEDPALSLATLVDLERPDHEVMGEGQSLPGRPTVRVASIERERILLDHDGVREQLALFRGEVGPLEAAYAPTPEQREYRRDLSRRLRELTDAGTNYRDVLGAGQRGGLLAEGDVSAAFEDGEMIGVQIDGIRAGGVYDRIGLRNGDVVTDINGVPLAGPAAMVEALTQFTTSPNLVFSVAGSDGTPRTVTFPTDQFQQLLGSLSSE